MALNLPLPPSVVLLIISVIGGALYLWATTQLRANKDDQQGLPLPPGPKPLPLIGNIHQLPTSYAWKTYDEWAKLYGPVFSFRAGKDTVVVLASHGAAQTLLSARGANYAGRPYLPMAGDLLTRGMHELLSPYDDRLRAHKKMEAPLLNARAAAAYAPLQCLESVVMLRFLSAFVGGSDEARKAAAEYPGSYGLAGTEPEYDGLVFALHRYAASVLYMLVYGFRIRGRETELRDAHTIQSHFVEAMKPGWLCDLLPVLNALPDALAPWKRTARRWFEFERAHHMRNFGRAVQSSGGGGGAGGGWNWSKFAKASELGARTADVELAYDMGVLTDAGMDTTAQTLEMFIMACVAHPAALAKAHAELDEVVGRDRLPAIEDRPRLPFLLAMIEETMRWRPLTMLGVPHASLDDDVYEGMRIPRGAIILPDIWTIHRDRAVYGDDAEQFRPERWPEDPKLPNHSFGFGRRSCTGERIARNALFIAIARLLWAFDFRKGLDGDGREINVDTMNLTDYFVVRPKPYAIRILRRHNLVDKVLGQEPTDIDASAEATLAAIGRRVGGGEA
jgi:cytochrome P450